MNGNPLLWGRYVGCDMWNYIFLCYWCSIFLLGLNLYFGDVMYSKYFDRDYLGTVYLRYDSPGCLQSFVDDFFGVYFRDEDRDLLLEEIFKCLQLLESSDDHDLINKDYNRHLNISVSTKCPRSRVWIDMAFEKNRNMRSSADLQYTAGILARNWIFEKVEEFIRRSGGESV